MAVWNGVPVANATGTKGIRGRIPTKRSINLVLVTEKKINIPKALFGILAIVALAGLFSKFLVIDRLTAMSQASSEAAQKKAEAAQYYEILKSYEGIEDTYAHYTYDGMTQEELNLVDRARILSLVGKIFEEEKITTTWSVTGNVLNLEMGADSLQKLNRMAKRLENSPIVESCTITTANKVERKESDKKVWAKYLIYLQQPQAAETKTEAEEGTP